MQPRFFAHVKAAIVLITASLAGNPAWGEELARGEIIVSAPSRGHDALKRQAAQFSRKVAETGSQEQFARRGNTYCPRVIGLPAPHDRAVLARLEEAARATRKVRLAEAGCKADLFIIFTDDAADLLGRIQQKNPDFFRASTPRRNDNRRDSQLLVQWRYGTEITGADGEPMVDGRVYRTKSSLISSGIAISLTSTVVIVDVGRAEGFPLDSIASFVAMIAFAQVRQPDEQLAGSPSVLAMFHQPGPRTGALRGLTLWDKAYLRALYQIPRDRPLWQQRPQLAAAMLEAIRELESAEVSAEP